MLGLYAKSGIQTWALAKPLNSDCFIGLDVSRENGVNKSASVQVIGNDDGVIYAKTFAVSQNGEAIKDATLHEIFTDAISVYKNHYNKEPSHITFHRDGRCFENLSKLEQIAFPLHIGFDYVEITKNTGIRMASFYRNDWKTVMGRCYKHKKNNVAYLCTTNSFNGMAEPIRITSKTSTLEFDKIIEDVWNLTFMHVHSLTKTGLPCTTYYADLCSTFGIRDWLPAQDTEDTENCLFFV